MGNARVDCMPAAPLPADGTCVATTCNATGAGSDQEYDGSRTGEGNCSDALLNGQSCVPACKAPDYRPVGLTTCNLGNLTTVAELLRADAIAFGVWAREWNDPKQSLFPPAHCAKSE